MINTVRKIKHPNSIGPLTVRDDAGQLIGHLFQSRETKLWTAYNKRPEHVWRKFGPASKDDCRAWIRGPHDTL